MDLNRQNIVCILRRNHWKSVSRVTISILKKDIFTIRAAWKFLLKKQTETFEFCNLFFRWQDCPVNNALIITKPWIPLKINGCHFNHVRKISRVRWISLVIVRGAWFAAPYDNTARCGEIFGVDPRWHGYIAINKCWSSTFSQIIWNWVFGCSAIIGNISRSPNITNYVI